MPDDEQQQAQVRSACTIQATFNFAEQLETWQVDAGDRTAGPHPVRILISNVGMTSCHFLTPDEADALAMKLREKAQEARSGLIVAAELPPPEPSGQR